MSLTSDPFLLVRFEAFTATEYSEIFLHDSRVKTELWSNVSDNVFTSIIKVE
jgi:hypothetical protein